MISKFCKYFPEGINETMKVIGREIIEQPEVTHSPQTETRITIMKAIPALISFYPSVVNGDLQGYRQMIESMLNLMYDPDPSISILSKSVRP